LWPGEILGCQNTLSILLIVQAQNLEDICATVNGGAAIDLPS